MNLIYYQHRKEGNELCPDQEEYGQVTIVEIYAGTSVEMDVPFNKRII